jgi:K+-transporting ATPase KdpF subunit
MSLPASGSEDHMTLDYALGGIVTIVILAYLLVALLRPERF